MEDVLTDPRFTDPLRRDDSAAGGVWGQIAGVAVLLLIIFLIAAGQNNTSNTTSSGSSPTATSTAPMSSRPSTTGSGSLSEADGASGADDSGPGPIAGRRQIAKMHQ
jgi:hypothetical protein